MWKNCSTSCPSPQAESMCLSPRMYLKCTMTTCHARLYAPAARQKGSFPISDQQRAGICVHLLLKGFTATAATWQHKVVACVHIRASACMCWVNECIFMCVYLYKCVCVCVYVHTVTEGLHVSYTGIKAVVQWRAPNLSACDRSGEAGEIWAFDLLKGMIFTKSLVGLDITGT